jgi:L-lactate dehydrogenase complex protein LldG
VRSTRIGQSAVAEFQQSLSRANATSSLVVRDEFDEALGDAIEEPAIGAELPFSDLSLAEHPVTLDPTPGQLREARTGVTGSLLGIAELGTVVVQSRSEGDEPVSLFPDRHVVVV